MRDDFDLERIGTVGEYETIWATQDYKEAKYKSAYLVFHIIDKDRLSGDAKEGLGKLFTVLTGVASAIFPAFAPFSGLAKSAADRVVNLIDDLDEDDIIFNAQLELLANPAHLIGGGAPTADFILQPGQYVLTDGIEYGQHQNYALNYDMTLLRHDGVRWNVAKDMNYIVLRLVQRFTPSDDYAVDEAAATMLSELHNASRSSAGANVMSFISDTFSFYQGYKKIARYHELKSKAGALTQAEQTLLEKLKADPQISKYLPAN